MKYILVLFAIISFGCAGPMPKLPADVFFIEILHTNSGLPSRLASFNMYPRILHLFFPDGTSDLNNCTNRGTKLMAHNNIGTKIHVELPAG